jgi:hypothetical protein
MWPSSAADRPDWPSATTSDVRVAASGFSSGRANSRQHGASAGTRSRSSHPVDTARSQGFRSPVIRTVTRPGTRWSATARARLLLPGLRREAVRGFLGGSARGPAAWSHRPDSLDRLKGCRVSRINANQCAGGLFPTGHLTPISLGTRSALRERPGPGLMP